MNPVIEAVLSFWHFHPIWTIFLGVAFCPEIEIVLLILALIASAAR
jgi:hypothetical protein